MNPVKDRNFSWVLQEEEEEEEEEASCMDIKHIQSR